MWEDVKRQPNDGDVGCGPYIALAFVLFVLVYLVW
jgi:hypothetical protein